MTFALGTFSGADGVRFVGIFRDARVLPFDGAPSVLALLQDWEANLPAVRRAADSGLFDEGVPMADLRVHAPVDLPRQLFFTGANYRKHVVDLTIDQNAGPEGLSGDELHRWAEQVMDERAANGVPYSFLKAPSSIIGAFDDLVLPPTTSKPDWELELGVVIGRGGRNIHRSTAMAHVAGYAIVNDVTARDLVPRTDYAMLGTDWLRGKSQPGFCPFGPLLVPAEFVTDPHDLRILLTLNGQAMQDESTADMIFDIARQIEYVSTYAELWPGDLISTGSPAGNGTHYGRFLRDGDVIEATITGLGAQRNRCLGSPVMHLVQNNFLPNAAMIAAEAINAFGANGVEVDTTFTRSSLDQRAALLTGEADVAVTALDNLFAWNQPGDSDFRAVAQIERATSLPVYLAAGVGSLAELAALERPRLVVDSPASGFGIALVAIVESLGVARERMEIIGTGGVNERLAALAAGEGDVALLAPFVAGAAAEVGLCRATAVEDHYPSYPGLVVVILERRAGVIGEALEAYLAALAAGRNWLADHPDTGVEALMATGLAEAAARAQLALCGSGPLTVSRDGFEVVRELRSGQGLLPDIPCSFDDLVSTTQQRKED